MGMDNHLSLPLSRDGSSSTCPGFSPLSVHILLQSSLFPLPSFSLPDIKYSRILPSGAPETISADQDIRDDLLWSNPKKLPFRTWETGNEGKDKHTKRGSARNLMASRGEGNRREDGQGPGQSDVPIHDEDPDALQYSNITNVEALHVVGYEQVVARMDRLERLLIQERSSRQQVGARLGQLYNCYYL